MDVPELKIGKLTANIPIIQGGMGVGISLSELASAVANEGAIGVIASIGVGMNEPDLNTNFVEACSRALRMEIRRTKAMTKGIIGVNIMVAASNYDDLVRVSIEEGADIIIAGAGLPLNLPKAKQELGSDICIVPIVSSGRAFQLLCKTWDKRFKCAPDAVVVEGPLAGGHLGFSKEELARIDEYRLEKLVLDVIEAVKPFEEKYRRKIPVIAAGGVYTGADIVKFIKIGAAGVQMGTRFVATNECNADDKFKQAYINAKKEDIILIDSPVGLPGRAINNKFIEETQGGKKTPVKCPYHCIKTCKPEESPYCIAFALLNAAKGKLKNGFVFCGSNAFRIDKIISVKELIKELTEGMAAAW
ncbi:MAG TPA: nitronate monooxygenase [Deltaproteobacteria bacterium]|nr:nitronate monooxygenase [Deltaproteobacteria bacterium]